MTTPATPDQGAVPGAALPEDLPVTDVTDGRPVPDLAPGVAPGLDAGPLVSVAEYHDYASAQAAMDFLSDSGFPVQQTAIVGTGLRLVENVLGRLTVGRAATGGAASGAWFGLFIGVLFTLFSSGNGWGVVLAAVLIGAAWGGIFGALAHSATRGRRDFTSRSSLQATTYQIMVRSELVDEARTLITRFTWRKSNAS